MWGQWILTLWTLSFNNFLNVNYKSIWCGGLHWEPTRVPPPGITTCLLLSLPEWASWASYLHSQHLILYLINAQSRVHSCDYNIPPKSSRDIHYLPPRCVHDKMRPMWGAVGGLGKDHWGQSEKLGLNSAGNGKLIIFKRGSDTIRSVLYAVKLQAECGTERIQSLRESFTK